MTEPKKSVAYYLGLPYSVELRREPDEGWFVRVREWPGCMSHADTAEEALANIQEVIPFWSEGALESDYAIPEQSMERTRCTKRRYSLSAKTKRI